MSFGILNRSIVKATPRLKITELKWSPIKSLPNGFMVSNIINSRSSINLSMQKQPKHVKPVYNFQLYQTSQFPIINSSSRSYSTRLMHNEVDDLQQVDELKIFEEAEVGEGEGDDIPMDDSHDQKRVEFSEDEVVNELYYEPIIEEQIVSEAVPIHEQLFVPSLGDGVQEGVLQQILHQKFFLITKGEPIAVVSGVNILASQDGFISEIYASEGQKLKVGDPILKLSPPATITEFEGQKLKVGSLEELADWAAQQMQDHPDEAEEILQSAHDIGGNKEFDYDVNDFREGSYLLEDMMQADFPDSVLFAKDSLKLKGGWTLRGLDTGGQNSIRWENELRRAFKEMRYLDVLSIYPNLTLAGENAAEMSNLNITALDYLGNRPDDVINSFNKAVAAGIPIIPDTYGKVIKAYNQISQPRNALALFDAMRARGVVPTTECYSVLLGIYYRDDPKDLESVFGIIDDMKANGIKPDAYVLDRLMIAFCELDRKDLIKSTYKDMVEKQKVRPNRIALSVMAETYLLEENWEQSFKYLSLLTSKRLYPRARTYELLIQYHLKQGAVAQAEDALSEMIYSAKYKPLLAPYKYFFKYYEEKSDYLGMQQVVSKMISSDMALDFEMFESLLQVYYENNRTQDFLQVFVDMADRLMMPSREFWTKKLYIVSQEEPRHFVMALKEYQYMLQTGMTPTEYELRLIMSLFYEANRPDLAEQFAQDDLFKYGYKYDATDYAMMIRCQIKGFNYQAATEWYNKFLTSGISNAEPHVLMIGASITSGHIPEALQYLHNLIHAVSKGSYKLDFTQGPRLFAYLKYLGVDGQNMATNIYDMVVSHCPESINLDFFNEYISVLAINRTDLAYSAFLTMQNTYKIGPTVEIYRTLLEAFGRGTIVSQSTKHISTAFDVFRTIIYDPGIVPLPSQLISEYLLFFIKHGNDTAFSFCVALYKDINSGGKSQLNIPLLVALRKAFKTVKGRSWIPDKYTNRNLESVEAAAIPELDTFEFKGIIDSKQTMMPKVEGL